MERIENTNDQTCACTQASDCATNIQQTHATPEEKAPRRTYAPAVDLIEAENEVILIADVPGVPEGGVELNLEKDTLNLVAVPQDGVIAGKKLVYAEYGVGEYRRSFTLSDQIDKENITASLKDGVLRVRLPKTAPVSRKISVTSF